MVHNDDTSMRVLSLDRGAASDVDIAADRTGVFTSGIVSIGEGYRIALYFTGCKHAGENLAEVLKQRAAGLDAPIQMCDALSRNLPKKLEIIIAHCLAHARRHFVEVTPNFPRSAGLCWRVWVKSTDTTKRRGRSGMSPEQRLRFHQEHSGPVMEKLHIWLDAQFDERRVEPNSGLGQAISYLLKHWDRLTLFLRQAGAPLDNNICERALKKSILHRKNSLFYKTRNGAPCRRSVHELDSHLRVEWRRSVRLSESVAAARGGVEADAVGVDALELPRDAGADRRPLGCGIGYAEFCMAEKDSIRPGGRR